MVACEVGCRILCYTIRLAYTLCACSQKLLSQTAVLKLNGGLGTSMGLEKAKSLLEVKDGKTFLDLIAEQIKYTRKKFDSKVSPGWELQTWQLAA